MNMCVRKLRNESADLVHLCSDVKLNILNQFVSKPVAVESWNIASYFVVSVSFKYV